MFNERLKEYREGKNFSKRSFAEILGISECYYNMIENGKRSPSKSFINKLVSESNIPEEYWLYGIKRVDELKHIRNAIKQLTELDLVSDVNKLFSGNYSEGTIEALLIAALKKDIISILPQQNDRKKE